MDTIHTRMFRLGIILLTISMTGFNSVHAQGASDHYVIASDRSNVGSGDYILQPGIPDCGGDPGEKALTVLSTIVSAANTGENIPFTSAYAILHDLWPAMGGKTAGFGAELLDGAFGTRRYANCVVMMVIIPADARLLHINFFATNNVGGPVGAPATGCSAWFPDERAGPGPYVCAVGWSSFDAPRRTTQGQFSIVTSVYRNWSHNLTRTAQMDVLWY